MCPAAIQRPPCFSGRPAADTTRRCQSPVTDPGDAGAKAIDELPDELGALREATSQLVFHYRAGGGFAANGVPAERVGEISTCYADAMFTRLKAEMLLWDGWGMERGHGPGLVPEADAAVLDEVSARTADPGIAPDDIAALAQRDGLRAPPTITRFDPHGGPPRQVDVSRAVAR